MAAKILMVGSIMMDLILQMPRIPHPSESLLGTSYSNAGRAVREATPQWPQPRRAATYLSAVRWDRTPTGRLFLACCRTWALTYPT